MVQNHVRLQLACTGVWLAKNHDPIKEDLSRLYLKSVDRFRWPCLLVQIGWIYGSVTEDILTGFMMHARGWRSVYCITARPAFKGSAPINLTDRLHQVLRSAPRAHPSRPRA